MTDRPVWISADRIRMDHSVGEVRVTEATGERDVTVAGELLSEGDPRKARLRLQLSATERELVISEGDWSVKLQRCLNEKAAK